jgi:hypothetical protein
VSATCACGQFLTTDAAGAAFCPACTPTVAPKKVRKSQLADEVPDANKMLARALMAEAHADLQRKKRKAKPAARRFRLNVSPGTLFMGASGMLFGFVCLVLHFTSGWTSGFLMASALVGLTVGGIGVLHGLTGGGDETMN